MPFTRLRALSDAGRASAMAASVASWAITYGGHALVAGDARAPLAEGREDRVAVVAGRGRPDARHGRAAEVADGRGAADVEQEPALLATPFAAARLASSRPRQREVDAGARDPDVEEAPLLGERLVVVERLADRQRALLEHRQEDRVPFEALRPVVGQEVDAVAGVVAFVGGSAAQLGDDTRDIGRRRRAHERRRRSRAASPATTAAPAPRALRPSRRPPRTRPRRPIAAGRRPSSASPVSSSPGRRRLEIAALTSGRS